MLLKITSQIELSAEDSSAIEKRVQTAMSRLSNDVEVVDVVVRDVNGPKGGVDQFVRLTAHLKGLPAITVSDCHRNVLGAATSCAQRLNQSVRRQLDRIRHRRDATPMSGPPVASDEMPAINKEQLN
jgi:putative sigma-54 modulation protein